MLLRQVSHPQPPFMPNGLPLRCLRPNFRNFLPFRRDSIKMPPRVCYLSWHVGLLSVKHSKRSYSRGSV